MRLDERTDVYGLGAILFAILTGDAPHAQSHRSLSSRSRVAELLTAIMNDPTPRARDINPEVAPELAAVCSKALARKRYARYSSASALAEDVQRWMVGEPVSAFTEPLNKRIQRWIKTHRRISQIGAVVGSVLIVTSVALALVTRQNHLAELDAQFDAVRAEGRELEVRLKSRSQTLSKNVRFMANLPPIQGIIDARNEVESNDGEAVWRDRLATIFRGLLIANPDYLSLSFTSVSETANEIVRVERHSADGSFVRVVPETRLGDFPKCQHLEEILELKPGDVFLIDSPSADHDGFMNDLGRFTVLAATPVFDEASGDVFGFVAIESNIEQVIKYLLESTANSASKVYVTDSHGTILLHHSRERGHQTALAGRSIESVLPDVEQFFERDQIIDILTDELHYHAIRIRLEARSDSPVIGVVLTFGD